MKKIGADPSCRFREKRKNRPSPTHSNSEKMTSPNRRRGYSNNQPVKLFTGKKLVSGFRKLFSVERRRYAVFAFFSKNDGVTRFLQFSRKHKMDLCKFCSRGKHLLIITCIKKHCTVL